MGTESTEKDTLDATMREVERFLSENGVFTRREFVEALQSGRSKATAEELLKRALAQGSVSRVAQGVYVSNAGRDTSEAPDPLAVASKLAPDGVVAYHSALEAHGVAHSAWTRVTYLSKRRRPDSLRTFGLEFKRVGFPAALRRGGREYQQTELVRRGKNLVRVTSRERTFVDCLARLSLAGGLEEVVRSLASLPFVDVHGVETYLEALGNRALTARVGWLLSVGQRRWYVNGDKVASLRRTLGPGPYYLPLPGKQKTEFVAAWRLYAPAELPIAEWVEG